MKRAGWISFMVGVFCLADCVAGSHTKRLFPMTPTFSVCVDTLTLVDQTRNRVVPLALYEPQCAAANAARPVVIFSHGYRQNRQTSYLSYSYLTKFLASKGYFVVSIQHELPTDSLMPATGVPQVVRRPFWERGADNILFVLGVLKRLNPQMDWEHVTLIGHSNGGDITALFSLKYPGKVERIITLDNRRMPLPRARQPTVYTLRSTDQPADEGVLPTTDEQKRYGITIVKLANTRHNDMDDSGGDGQHQEIVKHVMCFLSHN